MPFPSLLDPAAWPPWWFLAALGAVGLQRLAELAYARRTARLLSAMGARAVRPDGYGGIVCVHALWFLAMLGQAARDGAQVGWWTMLALPLYLAGTALRLWCMAVLGPRWSTRVWVLPEAPLVRRGPYRFLRHPIYLGVAVELAALPLAFGLGATAVLVTALHVPVLLRRIRIEERALGLPPSVAA